MMGHAGNIQNHVSNLCNTRNDFQEWMTNFKNELKQMHDEINELKVKTECLDKYVTLTDLEEVVSDVKNGFEVFLNATPRPQVDTTRIDELLNQVADLQARVDAIPVEFTIENKLDTVKRNIPKLNIQKSKKS